MPLRVLFLNWRDERHPESGGAERYLTAVTEGLAARGHDVTVLTSGYPGAFPTESLNGVRYVRRGGRYSIYPRALVSQALGAHPADVVVDVQNGVPYLSPLVRRVPVINLVHHVHREQWPVVFGPRVSRFGWWLESSLAPAVYRRATYVTVSDSTRRDLIDVGVDPARITVIHNGTDLPPTVETIRSPYPLVAVVGRLVPQKQIEIVLQSVADLAVELPDIRLLVVGSGYWEGRLREQTRHLGIEARTTFTGYVSEAEKHRILAESWVHALPSLKEGWGLVVTEAGIHGTPTVAFASAGGTNDSIVDGRTGVLVRGGQAEFTAALRELLVNNKRRDLLSARAEEWARRFSWTRSIDQWDVLIRKTVGG